MYLFGICSARDYWYCTGGPPKVYAVCRKSLDPPLYSSWATDAENAYCTTWRLLAGASSDASAALEGTFIAISRKIVGMRSKAFHLQIRFFCSNCFIRSPWSQWKSRIIFKNISLKPTLVFVDINSGGRKPDKAPTAERANKNQLIMRIFQTMARSLLSH